MRASVSKQLPCLVLVLATALAIAQDNSEKWVEVRSAQFAVVTDASEKQGRSIAAQFERMRALFQTLYPQWEFDSDSPVYVLALKSQKLFRALQPDAYLAKENLKLRGWFLSNSGQRYILMRTDLRGGDPFPVAFHEYTHLVLDEASDSVPLWLDEGLAEFYGNTKIQYEKVVLGEPNRDYLTLLRNEKRLPLTTLFALDEKSPSYIEKNRGSIFYAESWVVAQYLSLKDYEHKTSSIAQYIDLVGEKVDPVTAASQAFGDLKKLEKELGYYIQHQNLNLVETLVARVKDSEFEAQPITAINVQSLEADFLARSGRFEEARVLAGRVLQQDPENSSAQATLAFLDSAVLAQAEDKLRTAIQTDPSSAVAYNKLAVFLWKQGKDLDEAKKLASKSISLDAGNLGFRLDLANILLSAEEDQAAIETLRNAAPLAKTPEETAMLDQHLREAVKYESARAVHNKVPRDEALTSENETPQAIRPPDPIFVPAGPHRFVVGVLKSVHCDPPAMDLMVTSQTGTLTLHTDNFYQIQFTALVAPTRDLQPCRDLENRPAKVEYVESAAGRVPPRLIAIELRK